MRHLLLACLLALCASASRTAPAEVNSATQAQLESVSGIGPALAQRVLDARAHAPFADWRDLIARVTGLGSASAARLSAAGLTVNGASFAPTDAPAPKRSHDARR
jgi:competence protein ComEA